MLGRWCTEDPRVRGDDHCSGLGMSSSTGRPPRARGRRDEGCGDAGDAGGVGKTPACAGTTTRSATFPTSLTEDPRVRGDDIKNKGVEILNWGRPPRARGRPTGHVPARLRRGKTPACADPHDWGRPPRARGRLVRAQLVQGDPGKTPACAGTTGRRPGRRASRREDPRVRGRLSCARQGQDEHSCCEKDGGFNCQHVPTSWITRTSIFHVLEFFRARAWMA
ncbi:hypothetical protein FrEUN1fDRAFT_3413 [Parafrankia sp. EUN1f]|nr:hypothetical protein FrEUN1fDRAFT_3413 [Parafrankia sp. EUN1f]